MQKILSISAVVVSLILQTQVVNSQQAPNKAPAGKESAKTDNRPPGGNFIQNTTVQQPDSNFNISGDGIAAGTLSASIVTAETQFNLGSGRILSTPGIANFFAGQRTGLSNTTGSSNTFAGFNAGASNTEGLNNSFLGANAGFANSTGRENSFFGAEAGKSTSTGTWNSFFGQDAGSRNTDGGSNAFFGKGSGQFSRGDANAFFGTLSGLFNTAGERNSFFGTSAGANNVSGFRNTALGYHADLNGGDLSYATAVGAESVAPFSNSITLGRPGGEDLVYIPGHLYLGELSATGLTPLCRNAFLLIGPCAGSVSEKILDVAGARQQSQNYIQNTTVQQPDSNFNISGNGVIGGMLSALNVNAGRDYFVNGVRILHVGNANLFLGIQTGPADSSIGGNTFVGHNSGQFNTDGNTNTFVGGAAGKINLTGSHNSFFGFQAGLNNVAGGNNTFSGENAGYDNTDGSGNTFLGSESGSNNNTGSNNTAVGYGSGMALENMQYATSIGAGSRALTSNSVTLGRRNGEDLVFIPGNLALSELSTGGLTPLCQNAFKLIAACSSSSRYKSNVSDLAIGMELIRKLRPVSFSWKENGALDLGLVAEEVSKVEPRLTTTNAKGEVEGVKYDRVGVVLVNAVKEQQAEIDSQRRTIELQQKQIDALRKLVCASNTLAELCKEK